MALALALSALVFAPTASAVTHPTTDYLALGDSLAFGYTAHKFQENKPGESAAFFNEGYDYFYAKKVRPNGPGLQDLHGLIDLNDGCPGETTDTFLGEGAVEPPLNTKNCHYAEAFTKFGPGAGGGPLHNPYPGKSQMSNVLQILNGGSPNHAVEVISLNIGANDELAAVGKCKAEVGAEFAEKGESKYAPGDPNPEHAVNACLAAGAPALFNHINVNIERILEEAYVTGGYKGPTVVLGFYNPFSFVLKGSDFLQKQLNGYIEANAIKNEQTAGRNVVYANPFEEINGPVEESNAERVKLCKYTEMCTYPTVDPTASNPNNDIHPTKKGYEKLAKVMYAALPL